MEKVKLNDINFSSLQLLSQYESTATLYRDGNSCYKILDGLDDSEKEELYRKFLDMDGIEIENVLLPRILIMQDGKLQGYIMDYFENSMTLSDKFMVRYVDCKELFDYVVRASKILRTIHQKGIICQDLSFENILVDKDGNIAFCDLDGCSYKEHISPFISMVMKSFFIDYRKEKIFISANLDRIAMMISFYYFIYAREIQNLTKRQYHKLSNKIVTLENLKEYANMLVDRNNPIGEVPYLDELIDKNDTYIYDREEQLSLARRVLIKQKGLGTDRISVIKNYFLQ